MAARPRQSSDRELGKEQNSEMRTAKYNGGNKNCIDVNITDFGRKLHDITPGDQLCVSTHENAIVITPLASDKPEDDATR